jgi:2-dehydropantoate 2-reductase
MKVCIVGAGAIGGWIGARLAAQGHSLSALARGQTLQALQSTGLTLREGGRELCVPVQAVALDQAATLGVQDCVIVALKAPALPQVAPFLAPLIGPDTVVLTAMNGVPWWFLHGFGGEVAGRSLHSVDPGGVIARSIPATAVMGAVVHASCASPQPGGVQHHFGQGLVIGEPSGQDTPRLQRIATALKEAAFDVTVSACIQKDIWYKLWGNMTMNPISAITGATTDRILADDEVRGLVNAVMLEAKAVGAKLGIEIPMQPEDRHQVTLKLGAFKTSMLQDVEAGKPVELDALVGAVRELAQMTGVAMPFTDALYGLARLMGQSRGLYP